MSFDKIYMTSRPNETLVSDSLDQKRASENDKKVIEKDHLLLPILHNIIEHQSIVNREAL